MIEPSRKGWCPSLAMPMRTGDGLLVRLYPRHGMLTPAQLAGLAEAAGRHGNGMLEITTRGNLQLRGLSTATLPSLEQDVFALGIEPEPAPELRLPPLPALDHATRDALVGMAGSLRQGLDHGGLAHRLAAKFAIAVEAETCPDLAATSADIRVMLLAGPNGALWDIAVAGDRNGAHRLGSGPAPAILAAAFSIGDAVAALGNAARSRDLPQQALSEIARRHGLVAAAHTNASAAQASSIGRRTLADGTLGLAVAPAFGLIEAESLSAFCAVLPRGAELALCPGKLLLVAGLGSGDCVAVEAAASAAGMVTRDDDPRLAILACAGAPACASGRLATRALARRIADEAAGLVAGRIVYLAGCAKQCARPDGPHVAVTGGEGDVSIADTDTALTSTGRTHLAALARDVLERRR